jgi:DNA-binding response OmpR family regulator
MRILLVEDNHRVVRSVKMSLAEEGYAVDTAYDGLEAQHLAEITPFDLIILDIMLPGKSGLEVCQALRAKHISTPVLMLTALDDVDDRVVGLDSGADDYLVKPFAMNELLARLRALLRRETTNKTTLLEVGDLRLDSATHFVERAGHRIELTAKEYSLLEYFMRHPNEVITREKVETHVWSYDFDGISNVIDVYLRRLRRKIDDPFEVKLFETVRGAGYRLREPATR